MKENAFLLHIPHASVGIPPAFSGDFCADLGKDLYHMTDRYTDELFDTGRSDRLIFPVSRLVCDPERFRDDEKEEMAGIGMGAVYTHGFDLRRIRAVSPGRREEILRAFYDPHHRKLEALTAEKTALYGCCLIVDCHSFSAVPLPYEKDALRPDICIGTDSFHTPKWLSERLVQAFRSEGYDVCIDRPFSGTMVPLGSYRKDPRVISVMIEVNRGLYLTETAEKNERFSRVKQDIRAALRSLFPFAP